MRIMVTGSEGLIGKPLCRFLEARGDTVIRFDRVIHPSMDICDRVAVEVQIHSSEADAVIHLAAVSGVEASRDMRHRAWDINLGGTLTILEECQKYNIPVVVASSNHIYGHGDAPVKEDAPQVQLDTYSATKHAADLAARSYAHNYGLQVAIVRNTNCFGPDDPHLDHIIPGTIMSLLKGDRPVIRSTGETTKAYLYVDDVAEAYISVLDWLSKEAASSEFGTAFNVSGERLAVLDLVNMICALINPKVELDIRGFPNDQADEWLDDTLLRETTGWWPKHTLARGLERTIAGFRERYVS